MHNPKESVVLSMGSCILVFSKAHHSIARTPECEFIDNYSGY